MHKSPAWDIDEITREKIIILFILKYSKKNILEKINENIYEPINPEYVLFGLIFDNFLPLNILPNI